MVDLLSIYSGFDKDRIGLLGICWGSRLHTQRRKIREARKSCSIIEHVQTRLKQASDARAAQVAGMIYFRQARLISTRSSLTELMPFDVTDNLKLIDVPLLMMAGSLADSLYMSEDAIEKATGTSDKELFLVQGAHHIETYWKPEFVEQGISKLREFFGGTL